MAITQDKYPKVYKAVSSWLAGKAQLQGLPADMNKLLDPAQMVTMILQTQARVLFEILDDYSIHVGVWHSGDGWRYNVHELQGQKWNVADSHIGGKTRVETEAIAFEEAISKWENKL